MSHVRSRFRTLAVVIMALAMTGTVATAAHAAPSTGDVDKKIQKASDELEDVVESYNKMRINLNKSKTDEQKLIQSLGPAKEALKVATAEMRSIAATRYKTGDVETINVFLSGPGSLLDRMSVLDQMSRKRQSQIDSYTALTKNFATRQAALKSAQAKQAAQIKELTARKKKIEADLKDLYDMRRSRYGSAEASGGKYTGKIPNIAGSVGKAVSFAYNAIGVMYKYGADGPNGYDCSGLTSAAWRKAGKSLPHNAAAQYSATARISKSQLKAGDLIFYRGNGHVALYVGGGQIIDASHAGEPVKKRSMNVMSPNGYGRVK